MEKGEFFKRPTLPPSGQVPAIREEQPLPKAIGPYLIDSFLEKGGMSLLYMAHDTKSDIPLVIKVLSPAFLSHKEMIQRFLKEAEIIALADHPNIIKLYGYGEWEKGLYIAMEYVQGISLRKYLSQNPLSLKKALEIVLEIAYALCHLHTHGVIHRDMKPENVLVTESGHVKVIDFGIAQLLDPEAGMEDESRARLIGTPVYMSPEQRNDPSSASYPSDIYSLGIIAYELILGKFCQGHVHLSLMPKGMQKILMKALQNNPEERYLDIVDFISDVTAYLHSPQYAKEKKSGDGAGELFEKIQEVQQRLTPESLPVPDLFQTGIVIHRPLGLSALYAEYLPEQDLFVLGEPTETYTEGLMSLLYLKALISAEVVRQKDLNDLASALNKLLIASPFHQPLPCSFIRIDKAAKQVDWLSCGYGSMWKIRDSITRLPALSPPLGSDLSSSFQTTSFKAEEGSTLILCPWAEKGAPMDVGQFQKLLEQSKDLAPQRLADFLYVKCKTADRHYFEKHPFVLLVLHFPMEKK